jgi:rhodanese-related sulfurtransferase
MDTATSSLPEIDPQALYALIGTFRAPLVIDVRKHAAYHADPRRIVGAIRRRPDEVGRWALALERNRPIIAYCAHGREVSQSVAQQLRGLGFDAQILAGGIEGWTSLGAPTLKPNGVTGVQGPRPSRWVTRTRPKIDRIACPWLVRRFVDPLAEFHYVPPDRVPEVAREIHAIPFDVPGVQLSHRGDHCTFDSILADFAIAEPALDALAIIVRGADTARLDLAPQAPGLLALSLGLSVLCPDDHDMLERGMGIYDALYAWLRSARHEGHDATLFER